MALLSVFFVVCFLTLRFSLSGLLKLQQERGELFQLFDSSCHHSLAVILSIGGCTFSGLQFKMLTNKACDIKIVLFQVTPLYNESATLPIPDFSEKTSYTIFHSV